MEYIFTALIVLGILSLAFLIVFGISEIKAQLNRTKFHELLLVRMKKDPATKIETIIALANSIFGKSNYKVVNLLEGFNKFLLERQKKYTDSDMQKYFLLTDQILLDEKRYESIKILPRRIQERYINIISAVEMNNNFDALKSLDQLKVLLIERENGYKKINRKAKISTSLAAVSILLAIGFQFKTSITSIFTSLF